ncbi:MAG: hypothetical protein Tsb0014_44730 [Pleurocapsa sp.]
MKSSLVKLISAASITATFSLLGSLPVLAQSTNVAANDRTITPFALVSQAESGRLKTQEGISGYGAFKTQYMLHQVTAKSLVQAGINAHLVPAATLQDRGYINAVNFQMRHRINN